MLSSAPHRHSSTCTRAFREKGQLPPFTSNGYQIYLGASSLRASRLRQTRTHLGTPATKSPLLHVTRHTRPTRHNRRHNTDNVHPKNQQYMFRFVWRQTLKGMLTSCWAQRAHAQYTPTHVLNACLFHIFTHLNSRGHWETGGRRLRHTTTPNVSQCDYAEK